MYFLRNRNKEKVKSIPGQIRKHIFNRAIRQVFVDGIARLAEGEGDLQNCHFLLKLRVFIFLPDHTFHRAERNT